MLIPWQEKAKKQKIKSKSGAIHLPDARARAPVFMIRPNTARKTAGARKTRSNRACRKKRNQEVPKPAEAGAAGGESDGGKASLPLALWW